MRLRVVTYNIRSGTDILGRRRLKAQAEVIRGTTPDLVLLQEVSSREQAQRMASLVKLPHVAFGVARATRTAEFGNALLSRWPLEDVQNHVVAPGWRFSQARTVLAATAIAGGRPIHVVVAHFGLLPGEPELSARAVLSVAAARQGPLVVAGDFNRPLAGAVCHRWLRQVLVDSAVEHGWEGKPTFPAPRPVFRLDYVYVRELLVQAVQVVSSSASDHRPVVADLTT